MSTRPEGSLNLEPIKARLAVPRAHCPRQDAIDLIAEVESLTAYLQPQDDLRRERDAYRVNLEHQIQQNHALLVELARLDEENQVLAERMLDQYGLTTKGRTP